MLDAIVTIGQVLLYAAGFGLVGVVAGFAFSKLTRSH